MKQNRGRKRGAMPRPAFVPYKLKLLMGLLSSPDKDVSSRLKRGNFAGLNSTNGSSRVPIFPSISIARIGTDTC
jgi:hypothetical protein